MSTTETRPEPAADRFARRVRVPLPDVAAFGPVTARRMRRAVAVYAAVWLLGSLPGWLGAGAGPTAFGLGLVIPGGGFAFAGSVTFTVLTLAVFLLALVVWWFAGPVVLPPLVWVVSAGLAVLAVDPTDVVGGARVGVPAIAAGLLLLAYVVHRVRHVAHRRTRTRVNAELADVDFVISGPPRLASDLPVAESTPDDLAHLRYALDMALQPIDRFDGFTILDQYREAAIRYQLTALCNGVAMSQFTRTPAFSGYVAEAQRNAIEKVLQRKVWGYWAAENLWGNLSTNRDPLDTDENIMLSGWHGTMVGAYSVLNDDRYSRPGALTYRWSDDEAYAHDFHALAGQIHRSMTDSDYALIPCEPNWIYTVCNTFGINTLLAHDAVHGTRYFADVRDRLHHSYEHEFLRPDGRIVGVRARHLGLSWNFWAGAAVQLNTAFWLHAGFPDLAQRTWWLLRERELTTDGGHPALPARLVSRLDPGNYTLGRDTLGLIGITMAGREVGDEDAAVAAAAALAEREPVEERHGARRYADSSPLVNFYGILGRFGRRSGLRDLFGHGAVPTTWRQGPRLAEAAYPDVLVARAVTDGHALDLVLRPGDGPVRTVLGVDRLVPGRTYTSLGTATDTVTADEHGHALLEVDLGDRHEVRLH
ncbi:hypothetical protein [Actinomycetospora sp. NBRC 106378]|uniref:linalool dehydratase/isomerase domain-containing protein n=1 Tax=Actinomycetospora sp. NBRC 106378 TaxID=3032208 RepID=UPI0024A4EFD6|nr:hypothetical protein [Actinomycetospora sp. NBRC 106378]GLZ55341.1 hypothetical protein Acsp07_49580 [Actinomycetospora sp. NBRC 106378]